MLMCSATGNRDYQQLRKPSKGVGVSKWMTELPKKHYISVLKPKPSFLAYGLMNNLWNWRREVIRRITWQSLLRLWSCSVRRKMWRLSMSLSISLGKTNSYSSKLKLNPLNAYQRCINLGSTKIIWVSAQFFFHLILVRQHKLWN